MAVVDAELLPVAAAAQGATSVLPRLDGQEGVGLAPGDEVTLGLSRATVRMVQNPGRSFGRALQDKLGWQGSERRSM